MRVLLIGGNGFIGRFLAAGLQKHGHEIAIFHRGITPLSVGATEILGDRRELRTSAAALKNFQPDLVIDFVISSGRQAEELMNVFRGATGRILMLSSIDVYRAVGVG